MADPSTQVQVPLKKLVIDRRTWYRGQSSSASSLLRPDGTMCCMGFWAKQICGLRDDQIYHQSVLARLLTIEGSKTLTPEQQAIVHGFRPFTDNQSITQEGHNSYDPWSDIYICNDTPTIGPEEREKLIVAHFLRNGIEVEFTN